MPPAEAGGDALTPHLIQVRFTRADPPGRDGDALQPKINNQSNQLAVTQESAGTRRAFDMRQCLPQCAD
jgi:hypothetical protein